VTPFNQLGFVVDDLDEAVGYWVDVVGVAPFFVYRDFTLAECFYGGEPISLTISVAYGQAGDVQIELVEQDGNTPSPYLGRVSGDAHHAAIWTRDYDRLLERYRSRGLDEVMWGSASGRSDERFAYLAPAGPGPMLEVVEVLDAKTEWYRSIAEAARTYDGTEPVRESTART
jgi:catechol 2,3-dioxygenase-like lactoylglutathione lyase family enzyme